MKNIILFYICLMTLPLSLWANTLYEINTRQYSSEGTFQKVSEDLERLKALGVTTLWFMPIQKIGVKNRKGTLGSPYSISDYRSINEELGTKDDFKKLVTKAHQLKLKVIIDWVANHTAWDHTWTLTHPDYYTKKNGDFTPPAEGWDDIIDLNYSNKLLWQAMIEEMRYWLKEYNIDGFRCDVASLVPTEFWIEARKELRKDKDLFMLAESGDINLVDVKAFDAIYADDLYDLFFEVLDGKKRPEMIFNVVKNRYVSGHADRVYMNFSDNHDKNSWVGTLFDLTRNGSAYESFIALSFTLPGATLVYNGLEAPLQKRLAFFEKDLIEWNAYPYQNFISKLASLKKTHPALSDSGEGTFNIIYSTVWEDRDLLMFERTNQNQTIVMMMNLSPYDRSFSLYNKEVIPDGIYTNYETLTKINLKTQEQFRLRPWEFRLYLR